MTHVNVFLLLFFFLGVPISSDLFVEKALDETIKKLECLIAKLGQLKSNLMKFLLLRASFGAYGKAIASQSAAMLAA